MTAVAAALVLTARDGASPRCRRSSSGDSSSGSSKRQAIRIRPSIHRQARQRWGRRTCVRVGTSRRLVRLRRRRRMRWQPAQPRLQAAGLPRQRQQRTSEAAPGADRRTGQTLLSRSSGDGVAAAATMAAAMAAAAAAAAGAATAMGMAWPLRKPAALHMVAVMAGTAAAMAPQTKPGWRLHRTTGAPQLRRLQQRHRQPMQQPQAVGCPAEHRHTVRHAEASTVHCMAVEAHVSCTFAVSAAHLDAVSAMFAVARRCSDRQGPGSAGRGCTGFCRRSCRRVASQLAGAHPAAGGRHEREAAASAGRAHAPGPARRYSIGDCIQIPQHLMIETITHQQHTRRRSSGRLPGVCLRHGQP